MSLVSIRSATVLLTSSLLVLGCVDPSGYTEDTNTTSGTTTDVDIEPRAGEVPVRRRCVPPLTSSEKGPGPKPLEPDADDDKTPQKPLPVCPIKLPPTGLPPLLL